MINWEELKHIHVIRKLEQILAQWFHTEIFFLDEKGVPRNYDPLDRQRQFKNPLCATLLPVEKGREWIVGKMSEVTEVALQESRSSFMIDGHFGFDKAFVSRIVIDGEYLGCVYAYSFIDGAPSAQSLVNAKNQVAEAGLDAEFFDEALKKMTVLVSNEKKYFFEMVELVAQEIIAFQGEISKRQALKSQLEEKYSYHSMIGKSKPMIELFGMLDKVRGSDSSVLVQGENGTGKELIARAIHFGSPRKDQQFVTVNCSAFNENLLESELFGHVRGSFTGAIKDKRGLFEIAHRGTLFLDELGDMSPTMQVKLLRVLQEGTFMPVGGTEQKKVDVRIIAATNKNLKTMIEDGTFREDLFYRVNVINIPVPALRDRKEDIPYLIDFFLKRACKEKDVPEKRLAQRCVEKILEYAWPGNIRQLENEMERLVVLSGEDKIVHVEQLSGPIREFGASSKVHGVKAEGNLKDAIVELEKTMILEGLRRTKWNKSKLAKELGISRASLISKVDQYGLDKRKLMRAA